MRITTWPEGPYILECLAVGEPRITRAGNKAIRLDFQIVGTDKMVYQFLADSQNSRWFWNDLVMKWEDIPELIGHRYVAQLRNQVHDKKIWLRVAEFLCEVLP